ncbi:MAG: putative sulfate exporter family transporter [Candidatus Rokubacteria bacterium]|nr:putative sulfate exporter family transporter [Candidatus Rokubacteria bacterium]
MRAQVATIAGAVPGPLPGWVLMIAVAAGCSVLADLLASSIAVGGRSPVEPVTLAIILGLLLRNTGWVPAACDTGIKSYEAALKAGVVLLGLGLAFHQAIRLGAQALAVVGVCLLTAPVLIHVIAKRLGVARGLGILIAVGTTICGSTAIAMAAPAIEARDEEVSYAIGTISVLGVLALLTLPLVGAAVGMGDAEFGIWVGTAVPATPQVIGAASIYGNGAIPGATVVKMTRNLFMIPAVLLLGLWWARQKASAAGTRLRGGDYRKAVPAFLFGFLLLVGVRSLVDQLEILPRDLWERTLDAAAWAARVSILIAMAGIGLNTRLAALRKVGGAPLLVGFLGAVSLGAISYALVRGLGVGH